MPKQKFHSRSALIVGAAALCLTFAPAAIAAKNTAGHKGGGGSTGGTGSISLVVLNSPDGLPHHGGKVTFNLSTTATSEPWVELTCYQNGSSVYVGWKGFFERSLTTREFTLASNSWTSGAADCTAWLETPKGTKLASTGFHVYE